MMRTTWSRGQVTLNEDDNSQRKLKIRFEKSDIMEICLKTPTLLELNQMMPQGKLYLNKSDLIFVPTKITYSIAQKKNLFHKYMAPCFSTYKVIFFLELVFQFENLL